MANYPQELVQDAAYQSHTSRVTELWSLPKPAQGLNTNNNNNNNNNNIIIIFILLSCKIGLLRCWPLLHESRNSKLVALSIDDSKRRGGILHIKDVCSVSLNRFYLHPSSWRHKTFPLSLTGISVSINWNPKPLSMADVIDVFTAQLLHTLRSTNLTVVWILTLKIEAFWQSRAT